MLNIFVLGATGRTGRLVTQMALSRGHRATAFVRASSLPANDRLRNVVGDPRKIDELSAALPGHDAVISALGNPARGDERLVSQAASAALTAMSALNIKRYVCVSGALLFPSVNPAIILLRTVMAGKLADARRMEQLVTASTSEWTIVRPPRLKSGDQSLGYRTRVGGRPSESWASLQFIDLAALLLDVVEQQQFVREIVGVGPA